MSVSNLVDVTTGAQHCARAAPCCALALAQLGARSQCDAGVALQGGGYRALVFVGKGAGAQPPYAHSRRGVRVQGLQIGRA